MLKALRNLRQRVLWALQRNADMAARLLNDTTTMHYVDSAALHPASRVSTDMQWHYWDGRRWQHHVVRQAGKD
jgi:hypothetical protein